jgi:hypothetical protein
MLLDAVALDLGDRFTFALERADEGTTFPAADSGGASPRRSRAGSSNARSSTSHSRLHPYTRRS